MKRWSTPQRVVAALVAVVLLAGAGFLVWQVTRPAAVTQTAPTTTLVKAQKQTLRQTVSATGTIAPQRQSYLNFPASGTVLSVRVNLGDSVKIGAVLAGPPARLRARACRSRIRPGCRPPAPAWWCRRP